MKIPEIDAARLVYAGRLGHTYVVMVDERSKVDGQWVANGKRRVSLETCSRQDAIKTAWEDEARTASVYQQVKFGKWKKVR